MIKDVIKRITLKKLYDNYVDYLNSALTLPNQFQYSAIDLFAGCGGLSLGFKSAGIKIIGHEMNKDCCETYRRNLNRPARTLTCRNLAGATSDMQRIRLDDGRRRRLTVREATRLQSFPDWFTFCGTKNSQYKQIGNAVPSFMAYWITKKIISYMKNSP